jgi:DNA-binding NarL/FixJ family response regulator
MDLIRIVLVEDHTIVRAGIRALLENIDRVEVVGEAGDGREAIRLIEQHHPDVVLMDIAMAGLNGLEATARIAKSFPEVRVIILSMHASEEYVLQALRAGAMGYILKDAGTAELEIAIRAVGRDETYLSPAV